jgi:hypothetical protein
MTHKDQKKTQAQQYDQRTAVNIVRAGSELCENCAGRIRRLGIYVEQHAHADHHSDNKQYSPDRPEPPVRLAH